MEAQQVLGGRYRLEDQLGRGGMAVVWRARDEVLGRPVAVKLLAGRHARDPVSRRRIRHEARAAAALSHPNVAQVYDFGESVTGPTCVPYVVMELVEGGTLEQRLAAGPLPPKAAFRICAEVAAALAAAHDRGLVHRDIKPGNVMVTPAGAKVVDFGIAAAVGPGDAEEWGDELLGTPGYLAPERISGDTVVPASDVYGVGVLLYRLLAGRPPWSAETATQMLRAHVYVEPAPLPPLPDVPATVVELCRRCLEKDPERRPAAREVAAVLARSAGVRIVDDELAHSLAPVAVDGEPSTVLVPPGAGRRRTRFRAGVLAAGGAAVAVSALLLWFVDPLGSGLGRSSGGAWPGPSGGPTVGTGPPGTTGGAPGTPANRPEPPTPLVGAPGNPSGGPVPGPATGFPPVGQPGGGPGGGPGGDPGGGDPGTPTGPDEPAPSTPESPPTTSAPEERTLTSDGGSVRATCTDGGAWLLSWNPSRPYRTDAVDPGPAPTTMVRFRHGNRTVQMTVTCADGVPTSTNTSS
ncbi:serine/threonine-protein kinase [Micromonospora sp. WMMD1102]|uniref:serine/threonine-protein kinase n=1 Tax=Micromonospora sp. WMMD1102 TaxID=3016105 RepID=UPI0024151E0D|nr:serine/threonine-protein kinase [Micromonospora sp. WMMD1102]MDG4786742.1 serine/threonine-protein kinase [Micromonospora sp. WMMD1102]